MAVIEHETDDAILNVVGQLTRLAPTVFGEWIDVVVVLVRESPQEGIHGAQLVLQGADAELDVSGELVLLAKQGSQLADDGAHHARGGARDNFSHLNSKALAQSGLLAS